MRRCDILYLHPFRWSDSEKYDLIPVGVIAIINQLRDCGYEVSGLNYPMEFRRAPDFNFQAWLDDITYKVAMVDFQWVGTAPGLIEISRILKNKIPDAPIIVGGMSASIFASELIEQVPEIDFVVRGDAEEPVVALVDTIIRGGDTYREIANLTFRCRGRTAENPISYVAQNIDHLDFVSIDFMENHSESCVFG